MKIISTAQRLLLLEKIVVANVQIRNVVFTLLFFLFSATHAHTAQATEVSFTGNSQIDFLATCDYGTGITDATVVIKRDGVQVVKASGGTEPNHREVYYRDTDVSLGNTYGYTTCCLYESVNGPWESCPSTIHSATVGEVGGILRQDLEVSGGVISLHDNIDVAEGVTLSISDATIDRADGSRYNSIIGYSHLTAPENGAIRIEDSTLIDIRILFKSAGNNLLSGNILIDSPVNISSETNIIIRENTFTDLKLDIGGATSSQIHHNSFLNSSINISDSYGVPTVIIDSNKFLSPETGSTVSINGDADITIQRNVLTGQYSEQYNRNAANGIYIQDSPLAIAISDNFLSDFATALNLYSNTQVTLTGNVFKDNDTGLSMSGEATANATGNTFFQNKKNGVSFSGDASLTLNNNCIAANKTGLYYTYGDATIDVRNNWWGAASGPNHYDENPSGTGDRIATGSNAGIINFIPWLSEPNCIDTPILPEPDPATLSVTVDQNKLPADGQSQAILTVTLEDESSQPIANAQIAVGTPEFGSLNQLSGTTDAAGQLLLIYTAPAVSELKGKDFVELNFQYPAASVSDSTMIEFIFASISVWADPHIAPYPNDVAIIPGDIHFPGRYQFTLRDHNGQLMTEEELTVSIADSSRARLEGNDQSGSQITVITDGKGQATVDYIYLGTPELGNKPFEDTITVTHKALSAPTLAKVSVGLDIEIADINTPEKDTGAFPKTLGMRLRLIDGFRPDMDLRVYLSSLEELSDHIIGINVATEWLNSPTPEFLTTFRSIFPNYGKSAPPELYESIGVINHADNKQEQVIVEAMDFPQVSYGANTLPAIIFNDPGNYWFRVRANPVILSEDATASTGFVRGTSRPNLGRLFQANVLENAESVFQSVACSFKPTDKVQFAAMTLLVDNPYSDFIPSSAAIKMFVKANGIICDFMQGNYATAAMNMVSLRSDQLEAAYTSGAIDITLEEFLRLGKIVRMNGLYSKVDNINGALGLLAENSDKKTSKSTASRSDWPEGLGLAEYKEITNKVISGEMSTYTDLDGWQALGILNDGSVDMSAAPDQTEYFSYAGVHVYLLPSNDNTVNIQTSNSADIYRFYRASAHNILTAEYNISDQAINTLLSFSLMEVDLKIDNDADGSIEDYYSPVIKAVDTTPATLEIRSNQQTYHTGDTFILSANASNPGESILVDVYFNVTNSAGNIFSIPELAPGYRPLMTNVELPGNFDAKDLPIFSFPVSATLSGAGQFKINAFLTYPGTLDPVGESLSTIVVSFP